MAKFVCPICLSEYSKSEIKYVCPVCKQESTKGLFEREPVKCKTAGCNGHATLRTCPKCGEVLPRESIETDNLTFSIVGVAASGKTNYITTMMHELRDVPGISVMPENEETRRSYDQNCSLVYEKHVKLQGTHAGSNTPQIWCIKNIKKRHGNTVPTYTFTVYDGAGEDYESRLNHTDTACRYIEVSKAVILILDPLILSSIRKPGVIDPDVMQSSIVGTGHASQEKDASKIVGDLASYIKQARGISVAKRLNLPVAVVLSKFDTIMNHPAFARNALVKQESMSMRDGRVNINEINQVDQEIRDWLYAVDEGMFIDALEANFSNFKLFGASSFGGAPSITGKLPSIIKPHRVLDPLLWLFKLNGFVD